MLDVYSEATAQTVTAQTTSAQVLDAARPFSGIQSGTWVVYTICGNVDFVFTGTAGNNGVYASVSGVFFGPPPGTASTTNMLVDTYGGLSQVVMETDGSGALSGYYVRAGDELLEVMRPGSTQGTWSTRFVHRDGIGSVRALTDESGTITDTRGYEAFGTKNAAAGTDPLAYGFAGEPFEATSQLAYHRARWMDSRVGRFAGMDRGVHEPELPRSWHAYAYAVDSPISRTDPTGNDDIGSVSEPTYLAFLKPAISPSGSGGPTGPVFSDLWAAETQGLVAALGSSRNMSTRILTETDPARSDTDIYPEFGGVAYQLPARSGMRPQFSYSLTTSGYAKQVSDSAFNGLISGLPTGSIVFAQLHTHPNIRPFMGTRAGVRITFTPEPDKFSDADRVSLNYLGSQWEPLTHGLFSSLVMTGSGNLLFWAYGVSTPSPATAAP